MCFYDYTSTMLGLGLFCLGKWLKSLLSFSPNLSVLCKMHRKTIYGGKKATRCPNFRAGHGRAGLLLNSKPLHHCTGMRKRAMVHHCTGIAMIHTTGSAMAMQNKLTA